MREILFRGKRLDNGEWVQGDLVHVENKSYISYYYESPLSIFINEQIKYDGILIVGVAPFIEVDIATIGQYTGLNDKTGKKIFEGDIISCGYLCDFFVEYSEEDAEYWANFGDSIGSLHTYCDPKRATVIGNIYDNPELLGEKEWAF